LRAAGAKILPKQATCAKINDFCDATFTFGASRQDGYGILRSFFGNWPTRTKYG
jgi:hypothetical protein